MKFRFLPVTATDVAATIARSARAFEFIVRHRVTHGIVEAYFFTETNVAHGDQCDLSRKPCVRIAGMIHIVPFADRTRHQEVPVFHLNAKTAFAIRKVNKAFLFVHNAPENGDEFTPLYEL